MPPAPRVVRFFVSYTHDRNVRRWSSVVRKHKRKDANARRHARMHARERTACVGTSRLVSSDGNDMGRILPPARVS